MGAVPCSGFTGKYLHHLLVDIKALYDLGRSDAQIAQLGANAHAAPVLAAVIDAGCGVKGSRARALGVPRVGVVHRDMQREIVGVYAQLIELIGGDQQVQRELLIAQVKTNDLWQIILRVPGQCQLHEPLVVQ